MAVEVVENNEEITYMVVKPGHYAAGFRTETAAKLHQQQMVKQSTLSGFEVHRSDQLSEKESERVT